MSFGLSLDLASVPHDSLGQLGKEPLQMPTDCFAAAHEGWSPAELAASTECEDVLAPSQPRCSRQCGSLMPSMAAHSFETLHSFWDPHLRVNSSEENQQKARSVFSTARVTCVSLGICDRAAGSGGKSIGTRLSRYIDPLNTLWAPSSSDEQQALLDSCHQTELFRIVVDLGWRKVVVDRGARHAGILLQALRYSFPALMVPYCETLPDHSAVLELILLMQRAESVLASYLPCLFFFFEPSPRQAVNFFAALESTLKGRIQAEEALFATTKARSSWLPFGWGQAEKPSEPQMSPGDETQFVDKNGAHLGQNFKKIFVSSLFLHDVACEVSTNTEALDRAIEAEISAYQDVADALASTQGALDAAPPSWLCSDEQESESPPSLKDAAAVVSGFTSMVSLLHTQVTLSMVQALVGASTTFYRCAVTQRSFVKAGVAVAKFVVDKEPLMSGKESLANTPAGSNPAILAQMKVLYAHKRTSLRMFLKSLPDEMASANSRLREPLVVLCRNLLSLHRSIFNASDAAHHTTSRGAAAAGEHPVLLALSGVSTLSDIRDC